MPKAKVQFVTTYYWLPQQCKLRQPIQKRCSVIVIADIISWAAPSSRVKFLTDTSHCPYSERFCSRCHGRSRLMDNMVSLQSRNSKCTLNQISCLTTLTSYISKTLSQYLTRRKQSPHSIQNDHAECSTVTDASLLATESTCATSAAVASRFCTCCRASSRMVVWYDLNFQAPTRLENSSSISSSERPLSSGMKKKKKRKQQKLEPAQM